MYCVWRVFSVACRVLPGVCCLLCALLFVVVDCHMLLVVCCVHIACGMLLVDCWLALLLVHWLRCAMCGFICWLLFACCLLSVVC